jgi:hypothetical protein
MNFFALFSLDNRTMAGSHRMGKFLVLFNQLAWGYLFKCIVFRRVFHVKFFIGRQQTAAEMDELVERVGEMQQVGGSSLFSISFLPVAAPIKTF